MNRFPALAFCFLTSGLLVPLQTSPEIPSVDFTQARSHELAPHRHTIPMADVQQGFNQLELTVTISPAGDVIGAEANAYSDVIRLWPQIKEEVLGWKFTPFQVNGQPATVRAQEYINFVPPERLPKVHITPPTLRPDSTIAITLRRSGCFGTCPDYAVTLTPKGILFNGSTFVVAAGKHTASVDPGQVRKLAARFIAADFYSMAPNYVAGVTDNPGYSLAITIDGQKKEVEDYVGQWVGMPAVITELEEAVDELAQTNRWIKGDAGLVPSLKNEKYNFNAYEAQTVVKEAASRGDAALVRELLEAGVPLKPLPDPNPNDIKQSLSLAYVGWLTAASIHPETLQVLIEAHASIQDQNDKDLALAGAARSGNLEAVHALLAYGANPNVDLTQLAMADSKPSMRMGPNPSGSVLIAAAESSNPELVKEILHYQPNLEARDDHGRTALFAASESFRGNDDGTAAAECVRLLVESGANGNGRDDKGNTPLHNAHKAAVVKDLIKLGANVNARNDAGETPIFTTIDPETIAILVSHGADLTLRNNKGETTFEAAKREGSYRSIALEQALKNLKNTQP